MKKFKSFLVVTALLAGIFGGAVANSNGIVAKADALKPSEGYTGGIDASRTRLWLNRGHYGTLDAIVVLNIDDSSYYQPSGYVQALNSGTNFAFYDVEVSLITGKPLKFHKVKNDLTTIWNTSTSLTYSTGDSGFLYSIPSIDGVDGNVLTKGALSERIVSTFFAKVLEGYLTCNDSLDNGYLAFPNIDSNFLPRTTVAETEVWNMEGNLGGIDITDYSGIGKVDYSAPRGIGAPTDGYVKYTAMQAMYNNNPGGSGARTIQPTPSFNLGLVAIIGTLSLTALAGFYFLKTKKQ